MNIKTRFDWVFLQIFSLIVAVSISLGLSAQSPNASLTAGLTANQDLTFQDFNTVQEDAPCKFEVTPRHQNVPCLQKIDMNLLAKPQVRSTCGAIQSMTFQDEYVDLGCTGDGFTGYFCVFPLGSLKDKR